VRALIVPGSEAVRREAEREGVEFPLRGLDENEIGELIERAWGVSAADALVTSLHNVTDGNPFFLSEILRQMAADGQLAGDGAKAPVDVRRTAPQIAIVP